MLNPADGNGTGKNIRNRDGIILVPYVEINGQRTISDAAVRALWEQMVYEGTAHIVFNETVKTSDDFLRLFKSPNVFPVLAGINGIAMGAAWLTDVGPNSAVGHFCMFKSSWGFYSYDVGEEILKYWFSLKKDNKPMLDVIIGRTPADNRKALKYIERLGFQLLGTIPYLSGGKGLVISYITRA